MAAYLMSDERVAKCHKVRIKPFVDVLHSKETKSAHYGGLMTCGSVWMCPVCAAKITERRRRELESIDTSGLSQFMITLTLQHSRDDSLKEIRACLADAWRKVKGGRWWQNFVKDTGVIGFITGTEVTYGLESGWHPHKHVLMWSTRLVGEINSDELKRILAERYEKILIRMGRWASPKYGLDVRVGDSFIAEYVAKFERKPKNANWSLAAEITKAPVKRTLQIEEHYTPFELLDLYLAKDVEAGRLFIEYALSMKGSRQLVWSHGTRKLLGLDVELTDEELAEMQEQDAVILAQLRPEHWLAILKGNLRGHLLEVAKTGDSEKVRIFLHALGIDVEDV
jgi:hypothetical protein